MCGYALPYVCIIYASKIIMFYLCIIDYAVFFIKFYIKINHLAVIKTKIKAKLYSPTYAFTSVLFI